MIKAVIIDLDGTAVDLPAESEISPAMSLAVKSALAAGIKICAATGRSVNFARPLIQGLNLKDPCVVSGGARIVDPVTEKELWGLDIPRKALEEVFAIVKPTGIRGLWNDHSAEDYYNGALDLSGLLSVGDVYFVELSFVPKEQAPGLRDRLAKVEGIEVIRVGSQREGVIDIHILNKEATKEHAIYELQKMLNITKDECVGVGDGHNDLHLFNAVGHKVAMGNAVPELKAAADRTIGSVSEDGLAAFLNELVDNKGQL